ncbi:mitochondrial tRNA-specific 2-thiouridylase 1-like [Uloborus diversus]|uniref:mitochondrial tRNA-specific 2-thiouridylase 1-like n=1 Tax=Uloborus diversus TaxID=327109 RepID=UPI00240906F7|nr:mitochondrial tRNA-specific 2-thiouridylase 1-like [Uloborus diversus]
MMSNTFKSIACAISGGVDSSVAALLLKEQGYKVLGVFMRNWDIADETGHCQADQDKEDASFVCNKLGIPLIEVNFVKEYWNNVFSCFLQDYKKGMTPNPDILCNKKIKFDAFLKFAVNKLKVDAIATGHYARIHPPNEAGKNFKLLKGVDEQKDQTFFLSHIPQFALRKCIFPVGSMTKSMVKNIAFNAGLEKIALKKESVGICFIGRRNFQSFIQDYIEPKKGNFVNIEDGRVIGQHDGVHCWTVGQRCAIGGQPSAFYVAERNVCTQQILVAPGRMHLALFHQTLITEPPYWISEPPVDLNSGGHFKCDFRFQHREPIIKCFMFKNKNGQLQIFLEKPLRALTPGQYAVFYVGEECLGSAKIISRGPSIYSLNKIKYNCCNKIAVQI